MEKVSTPIFAPQLYIKSGVTNIDFYAKALGAIELRRWNNADGTIHVAELSILGAVFHLHEESPKTGTFSPEKQEAVNAVIGLFVPDVDSFMSSAVDAGALVISPAQDYDYGYRQGEVRDPFGHIWMFQMKI